MLAVLAIILVVAGVWGSVLFRRVGLLGSSLAVLLAGSCWGHSFYHLDVSPIPLTADRLLLGVVVGVCVWQRLRGRAALRSCDPLDMLMLTFLAVLTVSTFSHDWRAPDSRALPSLLFFYLMPLALYGIARATSPNPRAVVATLATCVAFGCYLAVTSICEQQQLWSLVVPRYIVTDPNTEFLGRGRGPFLNPVGNGMFLCLGLFSLLLFWPRVRQRGKAVILLLACVYGAGIYCTLTRVVWLAAGGGLLLVSLLNGPPRRRLLLAVTAGLLVAMVVVVKWESLNAFKRDRHVSVAEMAQSASLRPVLAYVAWRMFLDRPLLGCGYRQYESVSAHYLGDRSTQLNLERARGYVQHNGFLSLLTETGMVGLGLFVLLLTVLAQMSWRLWIAEGAELAARQWGLLTLLMLCAYTIMAMFHDLALIPMIHMLLFFLAGVTRSLTARVAESAGGAPVGQRMADGVRVAGAVISQGA